MPPKAYRQQLWASVPLAPVARVAVFQALAGISGVLCFLQTAPGTHSRWAVTGLLSFCLVTVPLGRIVANLSRDHPRACYWSARAWAAALPSVFALTVADAYDGTGAAFAERMMTPFMVPCGMVIAFAVGAQGALLGVPTDLILNMAAILVAMSIIKLHRTYTTAYLALHILFLGGIALGYAFVSRYADLHEAKRDAADDLMRAAVAITQPYLITDDKLRILAVNQQFTDVLGYEADEMYGIHASTLLDDSSFDTEWVEMVLAQGKSELVWAVICKDGKTVPVRIKLGAQRCPINATKLYCAKLASMYLEHRALQLEGEKERLQWDWDLASQHQSEGDPREALGASVNGANAVHRTLGAMRPQEETDEAVSNANSFDHVDSSVISPTVKGEHTLIASARSRTPSSIESLQSSSVMDTVSKAAKKSLTRAPPPPKTRRPRPTTARSEPSSSTNKPKAGNNTPKRTMPAIEHDPRECS